MKYRVKRFSSAFEEFKKKYGKSGSLPVSCKTSDGSLHDGRIKANTEEEYKEKARKFHQDCENRQKNYSEEKSARVLSKIKSRVKSNVKEAKKNLKQELGNPKHNLKKLAKNNAGFMGTYHDPSLGIHGFPQGHIDAVNSAHLNTGIGPVMC